MQHARKTRRQPARRPPARCRRGATLVLFVVCLVPLIGFVALAVDVGMLVLTHTEITNAADATALAGARALSGDTSNNNNYSAVAPTAQGVFAANSVLGTPLSTSQLGLRVGRYTYNSTKQQFEGQFPGPSTENWNMVQATVTVDANSRLGFAKVLNFSMPNLQAVATAAHRPRDICLILDYSGSMRFGSLLGLPYWGDRVSNNQDMVYPRFGHYSSGGANLQAASATSPYDDANISTTTADGRSPVVWDFYTGATGGQAFSAAPTGYGASPGGDNFLKINKNTGSTCAQTLAQVLNLGSVTLSTRDALFEIQGYSAYGMTAKQFQGYTQGPGYWGKTFFIWPPDPRPMNDWRRQYFTYPGVGIPMDDNWRLWDNAGNWRAPGSSTYSINYNAILRFIKNTGPNPFPSRLQSGRILYYDSIPNSINTAAWPPTDLNQRFWKDYIDYVLGVMQTDPGRYTVITNGFTGETGYGADYAWGTVQITPKSLLQATGNPHVPPYMFYGDNPRRPRLHFWFGPMTMIDFLGNYNLWYNVYPPCSRYCWWPGTCHESPLYACKLGIRAALNDIQNNHPSDRVALIMFSTPQTSVYDDSGSRFNRVRVGLSQNYASMIESLWYPPATVGNPSATVSPYDANNLEVPRAMGGTCYAMALMLAYNQFSANSSLVTYNPGAPPGDAGGNGRKGAQKIIIFETDGAPNTTASASFVNLGSYQSYYAVRYNSANPAGSEYPSRVWGFADNAPPVTSQIFSLCSQLAASDTSGGYSTPGHKLLIHCLAFGPQGSTALSTLNQMQQIGNVTDGMPSYKIIDGSESTIIANLQTAIAKILQDGVQVSLIQ